MGLNVKDLVGTIAASAIVVYSNEKLVIVAINHHTWLHGKDLMTLRELEDVTDETSLFVRTPYFGEDFEEDEDVCAVMEEFEQEGKQLSELDWLRVAGLVALRALVGLTLLNHEDWEMSWASDADDDELFGEALERIMDRCVFRS